jgi:hypothetical protein
MFNVKFDMTKMFNLVLITLKRDGVSVWLKVVGRGAYN